MIFPELHRIHACGVGQSNSVICDASVQSKNTSYQGNEKSEIPVITVSIFSSTFCSGQWAYRVTHLVSKAIGDFRPISLPFVPYLYKITTNMYAPSDACFCNTVNKCHRNHTSQVTDYIQHGQHKQKQFR